MATVTYGQAGTATAGASERYTRVRLENGKTLRLAVVGENDTLLRGYEVSADGDEITGAAFDRRLHLIDKRAIVKRTPLTLDKAYGTLKAYRG